MLQTNQPLDPFIYHSFAILFSGSVNLFSGLAFLRQLVRLFLDHHESKQKWATDRVHTGRDIAIL